ncbi:unnamed protein product [Peniophora sp. CBMAI 1063]|nr:unnamed protein product [Peniophora sp. CBMAI 1063]
MNMSKAELIQYFGIFSPPRTYEEDLVPIRRDPAATVAFMRLLHAETSLGREDGMFYAFSDRVATVLSERNLGIGTWKKFVQAGVIDLCLDIIMREDFWRGPFLFCNATIVGTSAVVRLAHQSKDPAAMSALLSRMSSLWRSIWERRAQWKSLRSHLDMQDNLPEPILELFCEYISLHFTKDKRPPSYETYIAHIGLHAWVVYGQQKTTLGIPEALSCLVYFEPRQALQVVIDSSPSEAEADALALRIAQEFSRVQNADMLLPCASVHFTLSKFAGIVPYYGTHALITEASSMLGRISVSVSRGVMDGYYTSFPVVLAYVEQYTQAAKRMLLNDSSSPLGMRGEDLVNIFGAGICFLALDAGVSVPAGHSCVGADTSLCDKAGASLRVWTRFYSEEHKSNDFANQGSHSSRARVFCSDMRSRARAIWWPSLHQMQTAVARAGHSAKPELKNVVGDWAALGKALGLDAVKERARFEREARSRCAWRDCRYYHEKPDEVALLVCKRCGEARYCGRECQRSDWSKGNHKARCRRLM